MIGCRTERPSLTIAMRHDRHKISHRLLLSDRENAVFPGKPESAGRSAIEIERARDPDFSGGVREDEDLPKLRERHRRTDAQSCSPFSVHARKSSPGLPHVIQTRYWYGTLDQERAALHRGLNSRAHRETRRPDDVDARGARRQNAAEQLRFAQRREDASVAHEQTNRRVFRVEVTAIYARDGFCSRHRFSQLGARRIRLVDNPQRRNAAFKNGCVQCRTLPARFILDDSFPVLDESIRRCFAFRAADLPLRSDEAGRKEEQRSRAE